MAELSKNSESQTIPLRDPDPLHEVFSINLEFKKKSSEGTDTVEQPWFIY